MYLWSSLRNHVVPHQQNAYHPHMLRKSWLLFFFIFALTVEGFLTVSMVAQQTDKNFLAAVETTQNNAAVGEGAPFLSQNIQRVISHVLRNPAHATNWLLGSIGALLLLLIALAFFFHIDIQSHEALVGGTIVAAIALLCLGANIHFTSQSGTPLEAAAVELR